MRRDHRRREAAARRRERTGGIVDEIVGEGAYARQPRAPGEAAQVDFGGCRRLHEVTSHEADPAILHRSRQIREVGAKALHRRIESVVPRPLRSQHLLGAVAGEDLRCDANVVAAPFTVEQLLDERNHQHRDQAREIDRLRSLIDLAQERAPAAIDGPHSRGDQRGEERLAIAVVVLQRAVVALAGLLRNAPRRNGVDSLVCKESLRGAEEPFLGDFAARLPSAHGEQNKTVDLFLASPNTALRFAENARAPTKREACVDLVTPPPPHRPLPVRLINGVGRLASYVAGRLPRLDEASLLEAARRRTGLTDFGPERFREGLRVLLRSLEGEAALNVMGRIMARAQVVHALSVRLKLVDFRRRHPELAEIRVARPLFVLGLPRTGTTILYSIIAQDPDHRSPASWELADPVPPPETASYDTDPRIERTDAELEQFRKLVPNIDSIHPMGARLPQECLIIMAYDFHSLQYELCFNAVSYQRWYLAQDLRPTYSFHREVLQLLSWRAPGERWVLKSPQHLASLDALLAEYPDALIVQTHRDPVKVLPSVSSLHYALRAATSDALDPRAVGEEQSLLWSQSLSRATAAREQLSRHAAQFVDVQFEEILRDPMAVVRRIYAHFAIPLTERAEQRMTAFIAANPRDKHGTHHYTAAMFGLDAARIRSQFADYYSRFDVPYGAAEGGSHAAS
jgi:hypothetical protein